MDRPLPLRQVASCALGRRLVPATCRAGARQCTLGGLSQRPVLATCSLVCPNLGWVKHSYRWGQTGFAHYQTKKLLFIVNTRNYAFALTRFEGYADGILFVCISLSLKYKMWISRLARVRKDCNIA